MVIKWTLKYIVGYEYQRCRYRQVGNAVAVSVSRALGYSLGLAVRRMGGDEPLMTLPPKFSLSNYIQFQKPPEKKDTD